MTGAEWLGCDDPTPMLEFLKGKASNRKLRLFAVACCRRVWDRMSEERSRSLVLVAERFADGEAGADELQRASEQGRAANDAIYAKGGDLYASAAVLGLQQELDLGRVTSQVFSSVTLGDGRLCDGALYAAPDSEEQFSRLLARLEADERCAQSRLLHEIFGNPFRPAEIRPEWRTGDAVAIARQMYASRDFSAMPILGDALQDAGCEDAAVLSHCRDSEQVHVRGCWVVDLVLGNG